MKIIWCTLILLIPSLLLAQRDYEKYKETDKVKDIKEQVYVFSNAKGDFWTAVGEDKGKEYLEEVIFLDEGDEITYFMEDATTPFSASFSSEEGLVWEGLPQKKKSGFQVKGTYKAESPGEHVWRFTAAEKDGYIIAPQLTVVLAKKDWNVYKNDVGIQNQLELLLALAPSEFIPIQDAFIQKDIKETRYKSSFKLLGSPGFIVKSAKGIFYEAELYNGKDEAESKKVFDQIKQKTLTALKENCYKGPKETTEPPYSIYKSYYEAEFSGCGAKPVTAILYHYLYRGEWVVKIEVLLDPDEM